jgi:hypothetical protein
MPSYETLDTIADAYTPLLAIISLAFTVVALFKAQWRLAGLRLLTLSTVLAIAYGLMVFDARFSIWSTVGLDYSTHTAVALVLVAFLAVNQSRLTAPGICSLIVYVLLMLYQGYHTVSDIAVTAAVVIVPSWLAVARLYNRWPFVTANKSLDQTDKSGAPVS